MANSELEIRDNCDDNLRGKLDSNGALACKEEPLHSWVPGSNHELDGQQQQQLSLDPTAIYSNLVCNPKNITSSVVYIPFVQASIVKRVPSLLLKVFIAWRRKIQLKLH